VWSLSLIHVGFAPANPTWHSTWHPLRIKFPTEISKIPNNSFSLKSTLKIDNGFEKIDQRSDCTSSHYALYASPHYSTGNPTWLKKENPLLVEIQNTSIILFYSCRCPCPVSLSFRAIKDLALSHYTVGRKSRGRLFSGRTFC